MAATLRDIAERVGTSEATVSLVLNGRHFHRVSQRMRERIEQVAAELNYRPNRQAQLLAGGKTQTVAVLVNRMLNQFFAEYLSVLDEALGEHNYHVVPFETLSRPDRAERLIGMIDQRLCDAIVALEYTGDPERPAARGKDFPLTIRVEDFGDPVETSGSAGVVCVNYKPATDRLFAAFKSAGARRIGLLTDSRHDLNLPAGRRSPRARAHLDTLTQLGLFSDPSQCLSLSQESPLDDWAAATDHLFRREPNIDCLLVHNATVVPAVLHQLVVLGRSPGRDLAVATYDDPISARWLGGGLTVVREPVKDVAASLVSSTLSRLGAAAPRPTVVHEAELVVRASSALVR